MSQAPYSKKSAVPSSKESEQQPERVEFERVGGTETLKTDSRVVAATNRDLDEAVRERRFRSDLLFRLNVFPIARPPLRERKGDIALIADRMPISASGPFSGI